MKPRILISRSPESSGLYEAAVEKAGGEALSFHCPDPEMDFDGLILAGGGDVDPSEFGESDLGSREIDLPRDKVELALVNRCVCENKPILGICRGHQVVNIALGGNIYQDLSPALLEVHAQTSEGKNRTHPVRLSIMTMLGDLYDRKSWSTVLPTKPTGSLARACTPQPGTRLASWKPCSTAVCPFGPFSFTLNR